MGYTIGYCYWNAAIITFLCVLLIFDPKSYR